MIHNSMEEKNIFPLINKTTDNENVTYIHKEFYSATKEKMKFAGKCVVLDSII